MLFRSRVSARIKGEEGEDGDDDDDNDDDDDDDGVDFNEFPPVEVFTLTNFLFLSRYSFIQFTYFDVE